MASRHNSSHRVHAEMVQKASTQSKHEALATKYGAYYSCLLQLEYFDAVRFTVIDPMHNLFLSTAKHVFKLWVKNKLLTKKDLKALEEHIHLFDVGTGVKRLPPPPPPDCILDYRPCGTPLFIPVQRIWKKFACCSMTINDAKKLVISPIPRLFH